VTRPARVLIPLGLAVCLSLYGDLTLYAVLATQVDAVGLTLGSLGIMLSINRLIRLPANPLAGAIVDRWGRRRPFLLGLSLGVLTTAAYGTVRGFGPFLIARLLWGIAWALINVSGTSMVLDVSDHLRRGRNTGAFTTWIQLGFAVGPLLGGLLVDSLGFQPAMLTGALVSGAGLLVAALTLPETAPPAAPSADRPDRRAPWPGHGARSLRRIQTAIGSNRPLLGAATLHLIILFASEGVTLSTLTVLLQQRLQPTLTFSGLVLGTASAAGAVLAGRALVVGATGPLAGYLSDRFTGRRRTITGGLVVGIAGFIILAMTTSLGAIISGVALGALCTGAVLAGLTAWIGDLTPAGRQGAVVGAYATAGDIGSTAGPLVAFALLGFTGLESVYLLCALILTAGLLVVWRLRPSTVPHAATAPRSSP
jgi:MFS family permease